MKHLLPVIAILSLLACNKPADDPVPGPDDPQTPVENKTPGADFFYKGSTMSFASYLQDLGLVYRENGKETDPYASLKNHGGNCVRLQLDQVAFGVYEGATIDWQSYGRVVADAKKAKAQGLEIFLTLKPDYDIYESSTTHHNIIPGAWAAKKTQEVCNALYDWVYDTLAKLADEGIYPAVVAVGNEVNVGFLRPNKSSAADNAATGRYLVYGHKAVRDYASKYNPACLSAVHIANPAKVEGSVSQYIAAGADDFDIVAISYYPGSDIGHSLPYSNFSALAKAVDQLYGKKIMVIETAYTFTTGTVGGQWKGDWCDNAYNYPDWNDAVNETNYTPAKARQWLGDLARDIRSGGGLGLITWGTESLPDMLSGKEQGHGLGLYTYPAPWAYGSTWENNSYWDFTDGNNLHEGIDWMNDID